MYEWVWWVGVCVCVTVCVVGVCVVGVCVCARGLTVIKETINIKFLIADPFFNIFITN